MEGGEGGPRRKSKGDIQLNNEERFKKEEKEVEEAFIKGGSTGDSDQDVIRIKSSPEGALGMSIIIKTPPSPSHHQNIRSTSSNSKPK